MATKTKKATKKGNKLSVAKKVNSSLIDASMAAINTTIVNGEKWQKLASKLIKKSEKVREQQINMVFDTAEALKGQFISGTDKVKDLIGYDAELVEKAKEMAINHPVSKKVAGIAEDITEKVSENPMVQKAEKATEDFKNMGIAKYNELKGDVLEQASKIINKGEAIIEEVKSTPKTKVTAKKTVAKKTTAKKTVAKKVTATKAKATKTVAKKATATKAKATKVVSKAAPKKTVAKKVTTAKAKVTKAAPKVKATVAKATKTAPVKKATAAKATVAKTTEVKNVATAKVAEVKTEVTK